MRNFPFKIIGRLLTGMKNHTESITINGKLLEFTWSVGTFYNLLNKLNSLAVEIQLINVTVDGKPMTDSYKRKFNSDNVSGKMEDVILRVIKNKVNSRIHKFSKELSIDYLEFNFDE